MRPIYKSVVLESAILAVSLSLQAEVNDGSDVTTVGVDASTLDGLRVELASPKVSGALDLIASGAAVVSGSTIAVTLGGFEELAALEQVTYRLTVKARYGTQVRTLYALDITVPHGTLAGGAQEYEDSFAVVSTFGDGGGEFPDDYARQGDDSNATNTAIYEAMQGLTGLEPDVAAGKIALATAITAKGVQSSSDETLQQMAVDVQQITQSPVVIDGGEMYAKQLFGSLTTPNYWNLYEVLYQLLSDGRLENYGGILLAEYYKGYDSLALSGAGAGGAYVVSDLDENEHFKMYTEDTTHTWATEFDGKGNRWVAYCFANEYHNFDITDTNTSPRSIFIGRKVGTITSLVAGRVSQIIVPDGNELNSLQGNYAQNWSDRIVIKNLQAATDEMIYAANNTESMYLSVASISNVTLFSPTATCKLSCAIIHGAICDSAGIIKNVNYYPSLKTIIIDECSGTLNIGIAGALGTIPNITSDLIIVNCESIEVGGRSYATTVKIENVYIGYKTNDKTKTIKLYSTEGGNLSLSPYNYTYDVKLMNEWCKPLDIHLCTALTEDGTTNNITEHILKRLKQDEEGCGDGVTITLGQTNLDKLTSQESIDLLDALTNTYGYTFA